MSKLHNSLLNAQHIEKRQLQRSYSDQTKRTGLVEREPELRRKLSWKIFSSRKKKANQSDVRSTFLV